MSRGEKQPSRPANVSMEDGGVLSDEELGASLDRLLDALESQIQAQLDLSLQVTVMQKDLVILAIDGTSPLAILAPPELRAGGASAIAARIMHRSDVVMATASRYPNFAVALATPPSCGHVQYLVSTKDGGWIKCVTCDLGMVPGGGPVPS